MLNPSQGAQAPRWRGKGRARAAEAWPSAQRLAGGKDLELLALSLDSFFFLYEDDPGVPASSLASFLIVDGNTWSILPWSGSEG